MSDFNPKYTEEYRKELRNFSTTSEWILWEYLCRRQIEGVKFRRQFGVGPFIADFFSFELLLAIEVDGDIHLSEQAQRYDKERENFFLDYGVITIRFTNDEIRGNIPKVVEQIRLVTRERIAHLALRVPPARKTRRAR